MLILTRRPGEGIHIGRDIEIVVLDSAPGCVRIGVQAPRHVPILRHELLAEIGSENHQAAASRLDLSLLGVDQAPAS
jgi:carbon storage regulator